MASLEPMRCKCGQEIRPSLPDTVRPKTAKSWDDCCYKCPACRRAYSNAKEESARRYFFAAPELNVPIEVRDDLSRVLDGAVNVTNRSNKRSRFSSERSEDAVTWTVFSYLARAGRLGQVATAAGVSHGGTQDADLLLWGVPLLQRASAIALAEELNRVSERLNENPRRRTEPDAIIAWPDCLIMIEAKYYSSNERKPGNKGFARYLDDADGLWCVPTSEVRRTGYYELARNWKVGAELARARRVVLINLGMSKVVKDSEQFAGQVYQSASRRFIAMTWQHLLGSVSPLPEWLQAFAVERSLLR